LLETSRSRRIAFQHHPRLAAGTARSLDSAQVLLGRGGCQKDCAQHGGDRPCQKTVGGIPELHFGRMNSDPPSSETVGEIAADGRRKHRHHDEEQAGADLERGRRDPGAAPGDTTAKPIPAPNDKRTKVIASEAAAPADTAAQETPDIEGSTASMPADCRRVSAIFIPPKRRQRPTNAQPPVKFPSGNARMSNNRSADGCVSDSAGDDEASICGDPDRCGRQGGLPGNPRQRQGFKTKAGYAACLKGISRAASLISSVITLNLANWADPKAVDIATSAASRPLAMTMRPMRG
jgi:hypothetical protein